MVIVPVLSVVPPVLPSLAVTVTVVTPLVPEEGETVKAVVLLLESVQLSTSVDTTKVDEFPLA